LKAHESSKGYLFMNVASLIQKKRDGGELSREELRSLISGYVAGTIPDYQMAAFLMACYFRGMSDQETVVFTRLMLESGTTIDLSDIPGTKVDKHSTGGVGDKASLILGPIVASCGVPVPMISGRGLGHTGGTLDKLETIPGFRTDLGIEEFRRVLRETGIVMIGQTAELAPADRKMYALRDVTATIECIPLIAGSIMSKKLAEGTDALVLDVKVGRGAFMKTKADAVTLTRTLVDIGLSFGKETIGFITNMDQPLGVAVGNWLEVVECVECLTGNRTMAEGSDDLMEVVHVLSGAMLMVGGKAGSIDEGMARSREAVRSGRAYDTFRAMITAQGGNARVLDSVEMRSRSTFNVEVPANVSGYVYELDALAIGRASLLLGAGRNQIKDTIEPNAGILLKKKVGDVVNAGEVLADLHTERHEAIDTVREMISGAYTIRSVSPPPRPLIHSLIDRRGVHPWPQQSG
jgi:pyrimidine-nucleoside phosphorylase